MTERQVTTVNRTHADGAVAVLVGAVLVLGGVATWQAYRQWTALNEMAGHMGMDGTAVHGTHPVWYLLGTIVAASVIVGVYLGVRDRIGSTVDRSTEVASPTESSDGSTTDDPTPTENGTGTVASTVERPDRRVLDLLPEDERRILEPVLESPGLTQIALRDRSGFSKSKVSQAVTALEKRGLLYREPQGRTYRVYPSTELEGDR